jgi:hypothetical protein
VRDSREDESGVDVLVADSAPVAFCRVEIDCCRLFERKRVVIEVLVDMHLGDDHELDLGTFPVERTMQEIWSFFPSITFGTRYDIDYSKEKGPELKTKKTMNVRMWAFYGDLSMKELEALDFEEAGEEIADCIGVMNAIYCVAKEITASKSERDNPSGLAGD